MNNPLELFQHIVAIKNDLKNNDSIDNRIALFKAIEELEYILEPNKIIEWIMSIKPIVFPKNGLKELPVCEHDWTTTNCKCTKCGQIQPHKHVINELKQECVLCKKTKMDIIDEERNNVTHEHFFDPVTKTCTFCGIHS